MDNIIVTRLLELVEPLAALSICHLTATTRQKLANDDLSVNRVDVDAGGVDAGRFRGEEVGVAHRRGPIVWLVVWVVWCVVWVALGMGAPGGVCRGV